MQDEFIDDQPPIGQLTDDARESLRLAIADTPADHPDRARHTPGPWTATSQGNAWPIIRDSEGVSIAKTDCSISPGKWVDGFDQCEANARLIASSPDLLEALEAAEAYLVERGLDFRGVTGRTVILPKMRAAIAKATGEDTP
jgi:hypothetical protein